MDHRRRLMAQKQSAPDFRFSIGDMVEVSDCGRWFDATISKVLLNASDGLVRYTCKFPGHRQWSLVCFLFV